nr:MULTISPECIES: hypothetical protein [Ramlibacter]
MRAPPQASGSEVVAAATMPPVRTLVSAFSVSSERCTIATQGPPTWQRDSQPRQYAVVSCSARCASSGGGMSSYETEWVSTKATSSPAPISKSA